jgi:cyclopropane-fatty-acyl-phospholipid synthase
MEKHVFPNARIPSLAEIMSAAEGLFVIEDVHNIGPHYDATCMAWCANFQKAWPRLQHTYDISLKRKCEYYLQMSAGNFRARGSHVLQLVFTPLGALQPNCRFV